MTPLSSPHKRFRVRLSSTIKMHCDLLADSLESAKEFAELFDDDWECPYTGFWAVESVEEVALGDTTYPLLTPNPII